MRNNAQKETNRASLRIVTPFAIRGLHDKLHIDDSFQEPSVTGINCVIRP